MSDRFIGFLILVFVLGLLAAVCADVADGEPQIIKEHCTGPALPYMSCVTAGSAWAIVGTYGPDTLVGYLNDDIIHSGKGADIVDGKGGQDVCYVQPIDVVKNCEEER